MPARGLITRVLGVGASLLFFATTVLESASVGAQAPAPPPCCVRGGSGGGGIEGGASPSVTSWVRDPTQQVQAPNGQSASSCEPWRPGNPFVEDVGRPQAAIPAAIPLDGREY